MLSTLGIIGLFLAMTGLVGIVGAEATRRTFEIGVRMALGATARSVVWLVLRASMVTVGISAAAGVAITLAAAPLLSPLLAAGQSAADPVALVLVFAVLLAAAGVATLAPVRRAVRVDPGIALRAQ